MYSPRRFFLTRLSAISLSLATGSNCLAAIRNDASSAEKSVGSQPPGDSSTGTQIGQTEASKPVPEELILQGNQVAHLQTAIARLQRLRNFVGYSNFNLISWDSSIKFARNYNGIGAFELPEIKLIEQIFFLDAERMGFYGEKVVTEISSTINLNDIEKIPDTGYHLFKGRSRDMYQRIRSDIGDSIVLTSGIRNVVKQIYLFLKKTSAAGGNLSTASYAIAPPGYSFHATGDFDVGKKNFGWLNFTPEFTRTDEFKKLSALDYVEIRYPKDNPFGIKYEPWHIKVDY